MLVAATSVSSSLAETFPHLNPHTMSTLELPVIVAIAIYRSNSTFIGFNFIAFFECSISTLFLLGTTAKISLSEM